MSGWEAVVGSVVALGLLITFHEFGHFFVARRCGVGIVRFSIGFGPALWQWRSRRGTNFVLALLPLGGYVKMVDERDGSGPLSPAMRELAFNRKSIAQRASVILAGPLANLLLAFLLLLVMNNLTQRGVVPIVAQPAAGTPAALAGVAGGQEIVAVDGVPVRAWEELGLPLLRRLGDTGWLRLHLRDPAAVDAYEVALPIDHWLADPEELSGHPLESLGLRLDRPWSPLLIDKVIADSAAARAGVRDGDRVLAIDGQALPVEDWIRYVRARPGGEVLLDIARGDERLRLSARVESLPGNGAGAPRGRIGVMIAPQPLPASMLREYRLSPWQATLESASDVWRISAMTVSAFGKLIIGDIDFRHMSGPVGIVQAAGHTLASGAATYLLFLALLSVSLGIVNLLPIPVLDGGHLLFLIAEWIKGSPLSERVQQQASALGMALLIGVMLMATYNDVLRW